MERYSTRTAQGTRAHLSHHQKNAAHDNACGSKKRRLLLRGSGLGSGVGVFLGEAFDAACGVQQLLFAGEERVAIGADFDAQHCAFDRRARGEIVSTGTVNGNGVIVRVNTGFHESPFWRGRSAPHAAIGSCYCGVARSRGNNYSVDGRIRQITENSGQQAPAGLVVRYFGRDLIRIGAL